MSADNNEGDPLSRTLAPMLAELEDEATRLTNKQAALARELADVDLQLDRIESIRSAMVGPRKPPALRRGRVGSTDGRKQTKAARRVERILEWARERASNGNSEFRGQDVAAFLEVNVQGVGPVLAGMARRGEITVREDGHAVRWYQAVEL